MKIFQILIRSAVLAMIALVVFSAGAQAIGHGVGNAASLVGLEDGTTGGKTTAESVTETPERPSLLENIITLGLLILLQAVLGFDNLLYITLESNNAPKERRHAVRVSGIGIAIFLRIALLGILVYLRSWFESVSVVEFALSWVEGHFNMHSLIVLGGGAFIIYTAMKEIWHMISLDESHPEGHEKRGKSVGMVVFWIVLMNVVFSFDSILSAMALTDVFWVMAAAIVLSGVAMIWLSDRVADFLARNRMYEVLGLFVLFIVGVMLVTEGGHLAHLEFFGNPIHPMTKTTFYFVLAVLVLTDIVQSRYQKKLMLAQSNSAATA